MFTKNFYSLLMSNVNEGKYYNFTKYTGVSGLTGFNGFGLMSFLETVSNGYGKGGVLFGDGNTPGGLDDYKLSGNIVTSITASVSRTNNEHNATEIPFIYTITNNSSNTITIGEVAVNYSGYIIERTALDTPLVIEAGGIGQLTYTIRMNYPVS